MHRLRGVQTDNDFECAYLIMSIIDERYIIMILIII